MTTYRDAVACRRTAEYRRRFATSGTTAEVVPPVAVDLYRVVGAWTGAAGAVTVTVDGSPIATASGPSPLTIRFDRPEVVDAGRVLGIIMPAAGTAEVRAVVER